MDLTLLLSNANQKPSSHSRNGFNSYRFDCWKRIFWHNTCAFVCSYPFLSLFNSCRLNIRYETEQKIVQKEREMVVDSQKKLHIKHDARFCVPNSLRFIQKVNVLRIRYIMVRVCIKTKVESCRTNKKVVEQNTEREKKK